MPKFSATINGTGPGSFRFNLPQLKALNSLYTHLEGRGGEDIAKFVNENAWTAMKRRYFETKKNNTNRGRKYRSKGIDQKLEYRLFGGGAPAPVRTGLFSYEVVAVRDLNSLPDHALWQEEGTSSTVDRQPYRIKRNGRLGPITKVAARGLRKRSVSGKRRQVKVLNVPHPALDARRFILAYNRTMKQEAADITNLLINDLMKQFGVK